MRSVKKYVQEKIVPIRRDEVWRLLSDTNHMHRVMQSFKLEFNGVAADRRGVYRHAFTRLLGGYDIRWKEYPFEWSHGNFYSVYREYHNGPVRSFLMIVELHDAEEALPDGGQATRIVLDANVQSANLPGDIIIPITVAKSMNKMFRYTMNYLRLKNEEKRHPIPQSKPSYTVNRMKLDRLLGEVQEVYMPQVNPACLSLIRNHLLHSDDDMVMDIRPFHWAREWGCDRDELLRLFLYCTKIGIFNLSWHLICPNCRVSKASFDTLSQIETSYHCDFCGITFDNNMDKYMELCFSVHPSIRKATRQIYCIGGPAITPHIASQAFARANRPVSLQLPEDHLSYRLRVLQANHRIPIAREKSLQSEPLLYSQSGWSIDKAYINDDQRAITIHNQSDQDIVVVIERDNWEDTTVTAAKVGMMHEFRRMFSAEVLAPGHELGIDNLTFLFSDLLGSTVYYEEIGDAPAYGQVRKHFDYMERWIHQNGGSIVKKIGDAVMAVFDKPENGVKAALDIQRHIGEFNESLHADPVKPLVIKIGVHQGHAIAVNANDRMDYFGRHVNIAARVQGLSQGNDVIVSGSCMEEPEVALLLAGMDVTVHSFDAILRGIEHPFPVSRIQFT